MATDFTTWTALRTAIKNALADHIAGSPCTGSYTIGSRTIKYRTFDELVALYEKTYALEALENTGDRSTRVSFGSFRRYS